MDVDYGNDKGAYAIMNVSKQMVMDDAKITTWADYKRDDGELTFGLLSRVSPTGRYVVSTVKDRSVFVAMPDLMISQLFFPIKGILVVYDRETKTYSPLPGADDPEYVQSNAVWSPDGKYIVFARAKAYHAEGLDAAEQRAGRREGRSGVHGREEALPLRPLPGPVQRREGRNGRAASRRLGRRDEQLLPEVLAGREVDHLLQGQELHAAAARQRAVHHPGRGRCRETASLQHRAHELLAQLVVEQPLAGLLLEGQRAVHPAVPHTHRRGWKRQPAGPPRAIHLAGPGREHPGVREAAR